MKITEVKINILLLIVALAATIYSFFAQYYLGFEPCPLCIVQRLDVILIALFSVLALISHRCLIATKLLLFINLIASGFGVWVSYHHYWLTTLPADQIPLACGMPMAHMFKIMPLDGFLAKVLSGDAECATVTFKIFGLSAPLVTCGLFVLFGILAFIGLFAKRQKKWKERGTFL